MKFNYRAYFPYFFVADVLIYATVAWLLFIIFTGK